MSQVNHIENINKLTKNLYFNYFLFIVCLSDALGYFVKHTSLLVFILSIILLFISGKVIFDYHVEKSIDVDGNKINE